LRLLDGETSSPHPPKKGEKEGEKWGERKEQKKRKQRRLMI